MFKMCFVCLLLAVSSVQAAAPPLREFRATLRSSGIFNDRKFTCRSSVHKVGDQFHYVYRLKYTMLPGAQDEKTVLLNWPLLNELASEYEYENLVKLTEGQELVLTHVSRSPPVEGLRNCWFYGTHRSAGKMLREGTTIRIDGKDHIQQTLCFVLGGPVNGWVPQQVQEKYEKGRK